MKSVTDGSMFCHSSWSEQDGTWLSPFSGLRMPDDHQVTTGILLADALGDGRLGPAQGAVGAPVLLALHDPSSETACLVVYRRLPLYPHKQTLLPCADMSQRCQNRTRAFVTREAYSITASARPSNARDGEAGQLLRKASVVLDARGTPDDFINLAGAIS